VAVSSVGGWNRNTRRKPSMNGVRTPIRSWPKDAKTYITPQTTTQRTKEQHESTKTSVYMYICAPEGYAVPAILVSSGVWSKCADKSCICQTGFYYNKRIRGHHCHWYYLTVNQVMTATVSWRWKRHGVYGIRLFRTSLVFADNMQNKCWQKQTAGVVVNFMNQNDICFA
jgi:hypothetical protein